MRIDFSQPITRHYYRLKCIPRDTERQHVRDVRLEITPQNHEISHADVFGGIIVHGCIPKAHDVFRATLTGVAQTGLAVCEHIDRDTDMYTPQSRFTRPKDEIRAFYRRLCAGGAPDKKYDRMLYFMNAVYNTVNYIPGVSTVKTDAEYAMLKRCGVCQDFSHILISLLRLDGIPARYVVGMMRGEGESHAWAEANLNGYWYGLDPTNNSLVDENYIKISHGRDYGDCVVSKGVFFGAAEQNQTIKVEVKREGI